MKTFTMNKSIYICAKPEPVFDALTSADDIIKYYPLKRLTSEWQVRGEVILDGDINRREVFKMMGPIWEALLESLKDHVEQRA